MSPSASPPRRPGPSHGGQRPARARNGPPQARRPSSPARRGRGVSVRRRRWYRRPIALLLVLPGLVGGFGAVVLFFYFFASVPLDQSIGVEPTVVLDHTGAEIASLQPEASRRDIELAELPEHVRNAVLAAEDATFYRHAGVSLPGVFRAALRNLASGQVSQGGSTISQQYIKNVTADNERTALRKIREAALAVKLERNFSKDQILEYYLNTIYFGRGAYGIEAAAQAYYGKPASALDVGEAAQLAGVIPAPSVLDPATNPQGAERRYRYVLRRLVENDWLSAEEAGRLAANRPEPIARREVSFTTAPFFLQLVKRELGARLGDEQLYRGLTVTTTLDLGVQRSAERAFAEGFAGQEATGALVAMDPATGGVRALVAGRDGEQFNVAVDAKRQPGSTFKAFALAAWVEQGKSPESWFESPASMDFEIGQPQPWTVHNYGEADLGTLTLREATWRSSNTVYAQVAMEVGPHRIADLATRSGIDRDLAGNPAIVLGSEDVSPLELTTAYNTLASGGLRSAPAAVLKVERGGQQLYAARLEGRRAFSEQVAWTVTDVLRGVLTGGTGRAASIGRPAAGKTGTTTNYADAWFAGYTPDLTAVVWMGNRDGNTPMPGKPTGGGLPARVWSDFMTEALRGVPASEFPRPTGSLDVVHPSPSPTATALECPEGQVAVVAEGEPGDETDDLQRVCAPADPDADAAATPSPTPTGETGDGVDDDGDAADDEPTSSPSPSPTSSPSPSPTSSPSPSPSPVSSPAAPAPAPTPTTSGRRARSRRAPSRVRPRG